MQRLPELKVVAIHIGPCQACLWCIFDPVWERKGFRDFWGSGFPFKGKAFRAEGFKPQGLRVEGSRVSQGLRGLGCI